VGEYREAGHIKGEGTGRQEFIQFKYVRRVKRSDENHTKKKTRARARQELQRVLGRSGGARQMIKG